MKDQRDPSRLLGDVFAAESNDAFRQSLLQGSIRASHARHRRVLVTRAAAACALVLMAAITLLRPRPVTTVATDRPVPSHAGLAASRPLSRDAIVVSRPLSADLLVSKVAPVAVATTAEHAPAYVEINDGELFAVLRGRAIALLREPGQAATLVFLDTLQAPQNLP